MGACCVQHRTDSSKQTAKQTSTSVAQIPKDSSVSRTKTKRRHFPTEQPTDHDITLQCPRISC